MQNRLKTNKKQMGKLFETKKSYKNPGPAPRKGWTPPPEKIRVREEDGKWGRGRGADERDRRGLIDPCLRRHVAQGIKRCNEQIQVVGFLRYVAMH